MIKTWKLFIMNMMGSFVFLHIKGSTVVSDMTLMTFSQKEYLKFYMNVA